MLFDLLTSGVLSPSKVLLVALCEEILCSLVWWLIPDTVKGLGAIAILYAIIKVYERLTGPRVKVHKGAVFLAGKSSLFTLFIVII